MLHSSDNSPAAAPLPDAGEVRRSIIIHLGFPKTGTTTIQAMLAANSGRLGPGIAVSAKDDLTFRLRKFALRYMRNHQLFYWKWRHAAALSEMVHRIDRMTFETLIISDENMVGIESGKIFDPPGRTNYPAWVQRLDDALSAYDVTYVLYTREAEPWRVSAYNQAFKMRRVKEAFPDWVKKHDDLAGPDRIIAEFRRTLGDRLLVVEMKSETGPENFLGRFLLERAGVDDEVIRSVVIPPRKNESLPGASIELLRLIHANPLFRGRRYRFLVRLFAAHPEFFSRDGESGKGRS